MAIQTPEQWLASQDTPQKSSTSKSSKIQTPEDWLKTQPVPEPSTLGKVGTFLKPIVQDAYSTVATPFVRATQAEELLRTQAFGSTDSQKKAQEFATQPVNIGIGAKVKPLDTSSTKRAAQQTAGDIIKLGSLAPIGTGLTLAKEAALMTGAYSLGSGMSEGKPVGEIAKDTAMGLATGGILGKGLSIIGGAKVASQLAKKTDAQLLQEATTRANLGPIPEASSPKLSLPAPRTPGETPIQLPSEGILSGQQTLREGQPIVTTPVTTITPKIKPTTGKVEPVIAPVVPRVEPVTTPNISYSNEIKDSLVSQDNLVEKPVFKSKTLDERSITAEQIYKSDPTKLERIANGTERSAELSSDDALGALKAIADKNMDIPLINRLAKVDVTSITASNLNGAKLAGKNNTSDIIRSINKSLEDDSPQIFKKSTQGINDLRDLLSKRMEEFKSKMPTNEEINKLVDSIICT